MVDRVIDLEGFPEEFIKKNGFEYLLDDDYIVPEAVLITTSEIEELVRAQKEISSIFREELDQLVKSRALDFLKLPNKMIDLVCYSFQEQHIHLIGRFDFAGGIGGIPLKLLEYNADTPTMLPESSVIQEAFNQFYNEPFQLNTLQRDIEVSFNRLAIAEGNRQKTLLVTSLGFEEDKLNAKLIMDLAEKEGFEVAYADLPDIEFAPDEGVFIQLEDGSSVQFDYLYKLIPWEFICFEEPQLLDILHNLILKDLVYVINPPYALVYQSKLFLDYLSRKYESNYFLKSSTNKETFKGQKFVEKVSFGRLGENIIIYDEEGKIIEENGGDLGHFDKIYQEFTKLYTDEDGDVYQTGLFTVQSQGNCISFRRGEKLILDDDCQFLPHFETP